MQNKNVAKLINIGMQNYMMKNIQKSKNIKKMYIDFIFLYSFEIFRSQFCNNYILIVIDLVNDQFH